MKLTNELKAKLLAMQSVEEVTALVKEEGLELTPEEAEHLWEEVKQRREKDGRVLSLDELESISGGADRNWVTQGCAATVEFGSHCGSNDACIWNDVTYDYGPTNVLCPNCGKNMYLQNTITLGEDKYKKEFRCKYCGLIISKEYNIIDPGHH